VHSHLIRNVLKPINIAISIFWNQFVLELAAIYLKFFKLIGISLRNQPDFSRIKQINKGKIFIALKGIVQRILTGVNTMLK
jgi:hypothetical protein